MPVGPIRGATRLAVLPALLLCFLSIPVGAQIRDIGVVGPRLEDRGETIYTNSFAAIIGINRYKLRQLHLRYAVNDANAIEKELLELGFPKENLFKLLDEQATKAAIVDLLGDTLRVKTKVGDRVFIFFAGHGQDVTTPAGEALGYLVPWEGDPARRVGTMIPMTEVKNILREIPAKHVLLAVDACYSGHLASRAAPDDREQEARRLARDRLRLLITAGEKDQQAEEEGGHGVFTRKLIEGLRGGALEGRRLLTGKGLGDYVHRAVSAATSSRQTPFVGVIEGVGDFVLAIPREGPPPPGPRVEPPARDPAQELLARADGFMARRALTTPPGANAYEVLQEILRENPTHPGALERLERIANTYKAWAKQALDRGEREQARRYLESAKKIVPEDREVTELEARLAGVPPPPPPERKPELPTPPVALGRGDLYIVSEPPGARIEIDGKAHEQPTPALVPGLPAGKRRVVLRRGEEHGAVKEVEVVAGQLQNVEVALSRLKGVLYVKVEPFESEVKVNGRPFGRGKSPVREEVETGTYRVEVTREGYRSLEREVTVRFAETTEVGGRLAALPQGTLVVESDPPGADITIGGKSYGKTPSAHRLYEGRYRVSLKKEGYQEKTQEVMVPGGGTGRMAVVLPKIPIPPGMVLVPAGEFIMGDNHGDGYADERPSRRIYLDAFYIDKYPITNEDYRKFMDATRHRKPEYWENSNFNGSKQPVVGIDWNDANAYCRWAGKRLPTEAEWEKAARGPDGRKYPWGNEWDPGKAIFVGNSGGKPHPVDRTYNTHVSPYGAVDMAGNVWQWVADWFDEKYYARGENRNPKGPASGHHRVLRGGSWRDGPGGLRALDRDFLGPTNRLNYFIGGRCARTP